MATGKNYSPVTPKFLTSFLMPDNFRAFGIAPVSEDRAWAKLLSWPVVVLIDTTGHIHQTGYAFKELKTIREKNGLESMLDANHAMCLEGHRITADDDGDCFMLSTKREVSSIQHINKSGAVSTVLADLRRSLFDNEGLAYLIDSPDRKIVLFGDGLNGIRSVKWPRNRFASLFLSPAIESFYTEHDDTHSIAVDKKSDLICMSTLHNKIIVINKKGQKISEYTVEGSEFLTQHVLFDHTGCILVFNSKKSLIFRLSPDGHFIQTLFPEIKEDAKICEECNKSRTIPKCPDCKDKIIITAIGMYEDFLWVCRLTGEVEIYRLM